MSTAEAHSAPSVDSGANALCVSDQVVIRDVILLGAKLGRINVRDVTSFDVDIKRATSASLDRSTHLLRVRVACIFSAREAGASVKSGSADVRAEFELTYHVPNVTDLTQANLDAFAETNAVFNAWPYFREFLQSSLVRMGLPSFILPVLRIGPIVPPPSR